MQGETDGTGQSEDLLDTAVEMIDGVDDFIHELRLAFGEIAGFVFKEQRVKQQSGEWILNLVRHLGRSASEGGNPFLSYQALVSFDQFGCALGYTQLKFFPALLLEAIRPPHRLSST